MHHFLENVKGFKHHGISDHSNPIPFMIISSIVGIAGILVAWFIYRSKAPRR